MFDYVAMFKGKEFRLKANTLWEAKLVALEHFKPSRRDAGLVHVHLVKDEKIPVHPNDF